jgi:hypothetical protein
LTINEFGDEEIEVQPIFISNKWCFGRVGQCIPLKTERTRFKSLRHHKILKGIKTNTMRVLVMK